MRLLERLGQHLARRHLPILAIPFKVVRLPDLGDHFERFLPHLTRRARVNPHPRLLVGGAAPGAQIHPAARQMVHHCHPLGYSYRMMVGQDDHSEPQPDALGEPAQRPEHHLRAWRHTESGQEVMLHEPHIVKPHFVRQANLLNGFLNDGVVIQFRALHFVGEAEFHNPLLPAAGACCIGNP